MRYVVQIVTLCLGIAILTDLAGSTPAHAQGYQKIDCSQSKLTMAPMKTCRKGPVKDFGGRNHCLGENYNAAAAAKDRATFAYLYVLNKNESGSGCGLNDLQAMDELKSVSKLVREKASNWSSVEKISGVQGMHFDFPRRKCFMFVKYESGSFRDNAYIIRAYICGADNKAPLNNADIASFVASLKVKMD